MRLLIVLMAATALIGTEVRAQQTPQSSASGAEPAVAQRVDAPAPCSMMRCLVPIAERIRGQERPACKRRSGPRNQQGWLLESLG